MVAGASSCLRGIKLTKVGLKVVVMVRYNAMQQQRQHSQRRKEQGNMFFR
jgi:hypothetical protein